MRKISKPKKKNDVNRNFREDLKQTAYAGTFREDLIVKLTNLTSMVALLRAARLAEFATVDGLIVSEQNIKAVWDALDRETKWTIEAVMPRWEETLRQQAHDRDVIVARGAL